MVLSITFFIEWAALISGFYFYKKSDRRLNGITWLPVAVLTVMCYHAFAAAVLNVVSVPVSIASVGIFDLAWAVYFWYQIAGKKKIQKYFFKNSDIAFAVGLGIVVVLVAYFRYGPDLIIHYRSTDAKVHLRFAMDIVNSRKVSGMFFAALNNALFIEMLAPLTRVSMYYKFFIISDLLMLFTCGLMFYGAISRYFNNRFLRVAGQAATMMYLLGYPLNNMLYGYVYAGVGVTLVSYLIFLAESYLNEKISVKMNILLLNLGCMGIFLCYVMFMPPAFFGIFGAIALKCRQEKTLMSLSIVRLYLAVFLVPCVIGLFYMLTGVFVEGETVSSAIDTEGFIYKDLYSNFILLMPFAFYAVSRKIKNRIPDVAACIALVLLLFMTELLYLGMRGFVSAYYYYKNYYLLWMLAFLLFYTGIYYMSMKSREIIIGYALTCLFVLGLFVFKIEDRMKSVNEQFIPAVKSGMLADVYSNNLETFQSPVYSKSKLELYDYVYQHMLPDQEVVPMAGNRKDVLWYEAVTNQRTEAYYYWRTGDSAFFELLEEQAEYVLVLNNSYLYTTFTEYFDTMQKVYTNEVGFIGRVTTE